ncbi:MAG TPA: ribonuclease III [Chloroflexota bacterium]|nr:ribonuclease III [Chloroflexota bacterium]
MDRSALEERLGVRFRDGSLLDLALTHKSAVNEGLSAADNERLEFLGDAVLGAAVADLLYRSFPEEPEGSLTNMRATLVRQSSLAAWGRSLGLAAHIRMGRGEEERGGRERDALLASVLEAVIGAVYVDLGYAAAVAVIRPFVERAIPGLSPSRRALDPKSELQFRIQARRGALPAYVVLQVEGPEHRPRFTVQVSTDDGISAIGSGSSKQAAEQQAAARALEMLEESAS